MHSRLHIGVITRYIEGIYHGCLINGIHKFAKENDIKLFVFNTFMISRFFTDEKKIENYYSLASNHIDGWIVLSEGASENHINTIVNSNKPIVFIGISKKPENCTVVKSDNISGAFQAVEHLIKHGHRKIGFIGWMELDDIKERLEGYKNALIKNGLPCDERLICRSANTLPKDGRLAIERWINGGIDFTAILTCSDGIASGASKELMSYGLSVPDDIAVIGYDNSPVALRSTPRITSVDQNIYSLGYAAIQNLIEEIADSSKRGRTILINSSLALRESCGCSTSVCEKNKFTKENTEKKDAIIKYLEDAILKNSDIGTRLLTTDIDGIKKLFPYMVDNYSWECIGFWGDKKSDHKELNIKALYDKFKKEEIINLSCSMENFPPLELLPETIYNNDDILWVMPISSSTRNWGVVAYSAPFVEAASLIKYNIFIVIITLLGIAMDRDMAKTELEAALEALKQSQYQLIQSEKMVSLGGIVAGIAHEINTPIGVSVTAASFLDEKNDEILTLLESGKLKKSDLEKHINTTLETINILMINLDKASNLVKNFKQISADQTTGEKRYFFVKDYINDVLLSLNPRIKKSNHKIIFKCVENLNIYASPGRLSQIITNLVVNSLTHAFENINEGIITINIFKESDEIIIEYSDNGKGIDKKDIKKLFEPFFTTKRGKGGTGLGLNIVYNIINNEYKGKIKCKSTLGKGTEFIIRIPEKEVH